MFLFGGQRRIAIRLEIADRKIASSDAIADRQHLGELEVQLLDG
jgi:hypothetical protein